MAEAGRCMCQRPIPVRWEAPLRGYRDVKCGRDIDPVQMRAIAKAGRS